MRKLMLHSLSLRIEKLLLNGSESSFFFFAHTITLLVFTVTFQAPFFILLTRSLNPQLPSSISHFRIKMSGDGPYGPVVNGTQIVFFEYLPNKPAAISFVALFGIITVAHLILLILYRAWFFIPFILGGICKHVPLLSGPELCASNSPS